MPDIIEAEKEGGNALGRSMIQLHNLPFPPTMNHRMMPIRGRLILSPEHRNFKGILDRHLHKRHMTLNADHFKGKKLRVWIHYVGPRNEWFTKKDQIKKKDVENRHKALIDGVFKFLGLDDSQIFEIEIKKVVGGDELSASIWIEEI